MILLRPQSLSLFLLAASSLLYICQPIEAAERLKDIFWVWDTPRRATPGDHTLAAFAQAPGAEKAKMLGTPNILMAGAGIPNDETQADTWTRAVSHSPRIVWEICPDNEKDGEIKPPFDYTKRIEQVARLAKNFPAIEGVLLDDMSSVGINHGFSPDHVRRIRKQLDEKCPRIKIWGVLYSMNFKRPGVIPIVSETDVINLWVWHARDLAQLENHVAHCEKTFPGKPVVLGLYLRDYGGNERMTKENMKLQCATARKLAHEGRIKGVVFLTIDNDEEIVAWTADWIKRVGDELLGLPKIGNQAPATKAGQMRNAAPMKLVTQETRKPAAATPLELKIDDGTDWHFLGGKSPWTEKDGVINPPNERNLHSRAFYTKKSFADLNAEFEFNGNYRETGTGAAALIIRAADANHCYMVYFPWGGQQLRAKHFWAQLLKVDGDGYLRSLKSVWVPGVPSETDRWYKVQVEAKSSKINVWVDGIKSLSVDDSSFTNGAVGLAGYGWYNFRNIKINGISTPLKDWDREHKIPDHNFTVGLSSDNMPCGCVAPNGDILLAAGNILVRSKDKGRTWNKPETLPEQLGTVHNYGNTMFCTSKGRLIVQKWQNREETEKDLPGISYSESTDNGLTWSTPIPSQVAAGWPSIPTKLTPYGPLLEGPNGTLLRFLLGGAKEDTQFGNVITWSAVHCKAYVIRSTDGGKSWSAAIEIDRPAWSGQPRGTIVGSLDLTEPTGVFIDDNNVTVLVRPIYSPYMWQCRSSDSGASWDAAVRATFPGYAQSMARTASGKIACAHRYPQYSVNLSHDNGLHWDQGTVIDYPAWAMGCMVEVEPDVLLCTYMNWERGAPLLAQLVRVTADGLKPIDVLPKK